MAKINKSPVTQTTSKFSKLPTTSTTKDALSKTSALASRKHVRASVQKMANSSTVSSNPWKAKMLKPSVISKKQHDGTNSNNDNPPSSAATEKSSPPSSSPITTTTSTATVTAAFKNTIPEPSSSSSSSSSTPRTTETSTATKETTNDTSPTGIATTTTTTTTTRPTQQTEDLVNTIEKITATKSTSSSNSTTADSNNNNDNVSLSAITTKDQNETTVTMEKDNTSLTKSLSPVIDNHNTSIETASSTASTSSKSLSEPMVKPSPMNENLIHPLDKSTGELNISYDQPSIAKGDIERFSSNSVSTVNSSSRISDMDGDDSVMNESRDLMDSILNTKSSSPLPTTSSTTISSSTSSIQKPPSPLPSLLAKEETFRKTEERNVQQPDIGMSITTPTTVTATATNDSMQTEKETNSYQRQVDDTKVSLENALEGLRPASGNSKVSVASIHSFSDDGSASSSSSSDYGNDDDDIAEETTATTFSTNTSSNTLVSSSKSETITTSSTTTTTTTNTTATTAFEITLPWTEYANGYNSLPSSIVKSSGGKVMMADANEIGRQLTVSHAALIAMEFPILADIMDVEKWQKVYIDTSKKS